MPFFSSIGRQSKPVAGSSGLGTVKQTINANIYRDRSVSVMKNAPKSADSFFKKILRNISEKFSALFKGKRKMTVRPYVPGANAGSAFDEYRAIRQNGLSFGTTRTAEPQPRDAAQAGAAEIRFAAPDLTAVQEEAAPSVVMEAAVEDTALAMDETPIEAEDAFTSLSVRERAAILNARMPIVETPRSAFMQSMLFDRDTSYSQDSQNSGVWTPEGYSLRSSPHRSELYASTAGRFNIRGTGFVERAWFQPLAFEDDTPGAWPLRPPSGSYYAPPVSIEVAVAAWYAPEEGAEIEAAWRGIAAGDDQKFELFSEYLVRLGNAELEHRLMGDVPDFRKFVQELLTQVSRSPELLDQTLAVVHDGGESCDDRVFATFNRLQTPRVLDDVKRGVYMLGDVEDGKRGLSDLITAGRRQFRSDQLQEEAASAVDKRLDKLMESPEICARVASSDKPMDVAWKEVRKALLEKSEELETHLSMQIDNAEALDMDPPIKNMRFRLSAKLTSEERAKAVKCVKERENLDFAEWLSDWPPFMTFMESRYPAEYQELSARKDKIADELPQKIATEVADDIARMQEEGKLPKDLTEQARNALEIRFTNEKWHRIGAAATYVAMQDFADKVGQAWIVKPHWPPAA